MTDKPELNRCRPKTKTSDQVLVERLFILHQVEKATKELCDEIDSLRRMGRVIEVSRDVSHARASRRYANDPDLIDQLLERKSNQINTWERDFLANIYHYAKLTECQDERLHHIAKKYKVRPVKKTEEDEDDY